MAKIMVGGNPAPDQITMLGITTEETVWVTFPGGTQKEEFVKDHLTISKTCQMLFCPCCCVYVPFISKSRKMEYSRECGCCSCPYKVTLDETMAGRVKDVGCCDNGFLFWCCPMLTCGGYIKTLGMAGADDHEKFIFAKKLFPCWPCVGTFAAICIPMGVCCTQMDGCYHYCGGTEFKSITQPVFKGPWSRQMGNDPEKIGQFVITQRFNPCCCCCATPTPLRFHFEPDTAEGYKMAAEDRVALSLILQLYRGMPVPLKCFGGPGFQMPMGTSCTDVGLMTNTHWSTVQEVMDRSG